MMAAGKPFVEVALWLLILRSGINAAFGSANKETNGVVLCNERERQALLKFKHALKPSEYTHTLTSWVGDNCCRWKGVGCNNETGHVIKLSLSNRFYDVSGEIDPSLLELKHLSYLDLSRNDFGSKPIPKFFGSFLKLRYLNLSYADFFGTVPWQIGNISGLRYLDLHETYLQIENLQWLSHLSSLQYLDMASVNLSMVADWLQPINMIPSLSVLCLSSCGLRNFSTPLHFNLTSLTVLDLSNNGLEGPILSSLWGHCNLLKLDLSSNNFNGDLNGFLKSLSRCSANNLKKHGRLASIRELYLSNNNFSGTVPERLGQLSNLVRLKMSYNSLEGAISEAHFANLTRLEELDLSANSLVFNVSPQWIPPFQLKRIELSSCPLGPQFPTWLQFQSNLSYLDLSHSQISDVIPNWFWNLLSQVSYLNISHNLIRGEIPSALNFGVEAVFDFNSNRFVLRLSNCGLRDSSTPLHFNLTSLTVLDLSYNSLSLKWLDWLANPRSLVTLDLSYNSLKGPILSSLWGHCNLLKLDLSSNNFNGDLNGFLKSLSRCSASNLEKHGRLASIRELSLSNNNFSGTVPKSLGQLSNLVSLKMSYNSLEGAISEAHVANLTRLAELDLSANSLVFNVSPQWIPPFQLKRIGLSSCQLGPQFPTWLQFQSNLSYLDLSHSQISDVIPNWFRNLLPQVYHLNLSHNLIYGKIPPVLNFDHGVPYFDADAVVDLSSNRFVGPLPENWSPISFLDLSNNLLSGPIDVSIKFIGYLLLSNNSLHGSIPSLICGSLDIYMLDLSRNNLTGPIPSCFDEFIKLSILDLSYNNLGGMLPNVFASPYLNWLQLSHNNLSGVLPSLIGVQSRLFALDLSGNRLSGSIPRWLGENMSKLIILNLRSNMFHGNIPPQLSLLSSLQILDLANNSLSGEIPTSFGNFTSMAMTQKNISSFGGYYHEYATVMMKGVEMKYTTTLSLVTSIDLSRNNLSGEIPQELTSLYGLRSLNLSGNHLEGKIPKNIGSLKQLESLDLSQNHLSGKIPSSISSLTFLSKLNLSNNNLSGTIPLGNQLQTLLDPPSIYAGNYELCGPPLPKLCFSEVVPQPPNSTFHGEDEKDGTEHWLFYVVVALGFVAGFWLTCGILIFSKSWRIAYFRFFERLNERLDGFYVKRVAAVMKKIKG